MKKFLCICFSSTLQRTITFPQVKLESVNRSEHYRIDASGKAVNTARILAQLEKGCVTTYCPLGSFNYEEFDFLAKKDDLGLIYSKIPGKTRECWTLLDKTAGTTTEIVVGEPALKRTEDFIFLEKALLDNDLPMEIEKNDGILIAGSRPGIWDERTYPVLAKAAMDAGKILLVDFHGKDLLNTLAVCTPSIIKINEEEFLGTFGDGAETVEPDALKEMIIQKSKELENLIIITRGIDSTFAANKGIFAECPTEKVKAVNTTACGDSFNAGFLYEFVNSGNVDAALKKGTWCAARNAEVECPGSILPD